MSASAIPVVNMQFHSANGKVPYETPRPLELHEMADIVAQHKNAAAMAKQAGFDGVELHCANGYLIN